MRRIFFLSGLIVTITLFGMIPSHTAHARHSFLHFMFPLYVPAPEEDLEPDPSETLQAPFADPDSSLKNRNGKTFIPYGGPDLSNSPNALDKPHRSEEHLAKWLVNEVSEIMTLDPASYAEHTEDMEASMDQYALNDFQDFMTKSRVLLMLQQNSLELHVYVEETPLLMNAGSVGGRYRWLFEMPVTLTFLPNKAKDYKKMDQPTNQRIIVTIQVGRVSHETSSEQIMIESWAVRKQKELAKETE